MSSPSPAEVHTSSVCEVPSPTRAKPELVSMLAVSVALSMQAPDGTTMRTLPFLLTPMPTMPANRAALPPAGSWPVAIAIAALKAAVSSVLPSHLAP